jgi:hypothetical protein
MRYIIYCIMLLDLYIQELFNGKFKWSVGYSRLVQKHFIIIIMIVIINNIVCSLF